MSIRHNYHNSFVYSGGRIVFVRQETQPIWDDPAPIPCSKICIGNFLLGPARGCHGDTLIGDQAVHRDSLPERVHITLNIHEHARGEDE